MVTTFSSFLFVMMQNLGSVLLDAFVIVLVAWVAWAAFLSIVYSIHMIGIPLMRAGRPVLSFITTAIFAVRGFAPIMSMIPIKIMGGIKL